MGNTLTLFSFPFSFSSPLSLIPVFSCSFLPFTPSFSLPHQELPWSFLLHFQLISPACFYPLTITCCDYLLIFHSILAFSSNPPALEATYLIPFHDIAKFSLPVKAHCNQSSVYCAGVQHRYNNNRADLQLIARIG